MLRACYQDQALRLGTRETVDPPKHAQGRRLANARLGLRDGVLPGQHRHDGPLLKRARLVEAWVGMHDTSDGLVSRIGTNDVFAT